MDNSGKAMKKSRISRMHYIKLVYRSCLFLGALLLYVKSRIIGAEQPFGGIENNFGILSFIWIVYVGEMILRFFPSRFESMGCQKQFARNYIPVNNPNAKPNVQPAKVTLLVALVWLAFNGVIGALYYAGIIDAGILLLISLAYAVCDMICILFFCPFQSWIMKNKCCVSCRIYNWDYAMMFTPLVFIRGIYTWSLLGIALLLLISWEVSAISHPERFGESTNCSLACANCKEKLCSHKKQLRAFLKKNIQHRWQPGDDVSKNLCK